ncbi:hypothetical protein [Microbacterium sp.]|uniref:hypothetical protein n=1 Tax=Microbacterium sp. TaxID=51671 RepID=UPI002600687B|nr:hypothetical protein [Microbacterium sp.]
MSRRTDRMDRGGRTVGTPRTLIALIVATTLALAGCAAGTSPAPSASAQDVGAACTAVREKVADAAQRLTQLDVTDPDASARVMSDVAASLADAATAVDNPEIARLLPDLQAGFAQGATALGAIASGDLSQLPALQSATAGIQHSLTAFTKLCPSS